jgi:hypothetical protein
LIVRRVARPKPSYKELTHAYDNILEAEKVREEPDSDRNF